MSYQNENTSFLIFRGHASKSKDQLGKPGGGTAPLTKSETVFF